MIAAGTAGSGGNSLEVCCWVGSDHEQLQEGHSQTCHHHRMWLKAKLVVCDFFLSGMLLPMVENHTGCWCCCSVGSAPLVLGSNTRYCRGFGFSVSVTNIYDL